MRNFRRYTLIAFRMNKMLFAAGALVLAMLISTPGHGQTFPKGTVVHYPPRNPVEQAGQTPTTLAGRKKALARVLGQIREFRLKTDPEYASLIGDKRYDADLTDYSVTAYEQWLAQYNQFLLELAPIDTTGMTAEEQASKNKMMQWLMEQQQRSESKPWQEPVTADSGLPFELPELATELKFDRVKDYDDYIARLRKVPTAFQQITDDMTAGELDGRSYSPEMLAKVLAQVKAVDSQKPEASEFAAPLGHFPASVSAAEQARIRKAVLAAIATSVFPAYERFGRFVEGLMKTSQTKVHP
jgi:uncharacterized protein (DUF885 family)